MIKGDVDAPIDWPITVKSVPHQLSAYGMLCNHKPLGVSNIRFAKGLRSHCIF